MQIRLTVLGPRHEAFAGRPAASDVLVTAPAGTALAAVAADLVAAVGGDRGDGPPVLYAGQRRLDAQRCTLGEPPLVDGAVLGAGAPADPDPDSSADATAQLHVVAGPDAGGVHLLHGGQIRVGRSADADVPLDDPDVSRLHCTVTVAPGGEVTVTDLGSTNGTFIAGIPVTNHPVRLPPGAPLRLGESTLRLTTSPAATEATGTLPTAPDGEGQVRVHLAADADPAGTRGAPAAGPGPRGHAPTAPGGPGPVGAPRALGGTEAEPPGAAPGAPVPDDLPPVGTPPAPEGVTHHGYGSADWGAAGGAAGPGGAGTADAWGHEATTGGPGAPPAPGSPGHAGPAHRDAAGPHTSHVPREDASHGTGSYGTGAHDAPHPPVPDPGGDPVRGMAVQRGPRRRGGLSAWARRIAGGRDDGGAEAYEDDPTGPRHAYGWYGGHDAGTPHAADPDQEAALAQAAAAWPDPATLLLTALGPGTRLWERGPGHPEALTVRLGTVDRPAPGGGRIPGVPVTAGLREVGALGLAGPRARLAGLARSVVAQLAALHAPDTLEIVLISADPGRSRQERIAEWAWLGWLPHLRPGHGQDCRLLLAFDPDQAAARLGELVRRLEDRLRAVANEGGTPGVPGAPETAGTPRPGSFEGGRHEDNRPTGGGAGAVAHPHTTDGPPGVGPYTVVVVDGDPGAAGLRTAVERLAARGGAAGVHLLCLAETPAASPLSPLAATYESACAVSPVFRSCGAAAVLSGDVATALRLLRTVGGRIAGQGPLAALDAVSAAWAERFARALAPLRPEGGAGGERGPAPTALPPAARLLDELGLARATPASLLARWAAADDDAPSPGRGQRLRLGGGRARVVFGAGTRGPVGVDLVDEGPHMVVEGPAGSGRTELLRAVAASLAAAERPGRLGLLLIDGRDAGYGTVAGTERPGAGGPPVRSGGADGLRICLELPHATAHLTAHDPVRMREFAQSLTAELKRRATVLGDLDFATWHAGRGVVGQRAGRVAGDEPVEAPSATLRLRPPTVARQRPEPGAERPGATGAPFDPAGPGRRPAAAPHTPAPPAPAEDEPALPRLVVLVDDVDTLLAPPLGSPGRPAAGSVVRALEAVARDGARLGVHLVAAGAVGGPLASSELARRAALRVELDAPAGGADDPAPGRGRLRRSDGRVTAFQAGRVTGRIPRTGTLRPTVVPLEWHRMGDPPTRRSVRELGNGPTDLALLASALERAARTEGRSAVDARGTPEGAR